MTTKILIGAARRGFIPDSPDEMAPGQLRAPIPLVISTPYDESGGRVLTDPTGESRTRQFRQHFCGFRSCRYNPSGESGLRAFSSMESAPTTRSNIFPQTT